MAMILEFFVERYLGELAGFVEGETCKALGVKKEMKKLEGWLERIQRYLHDAEQKRHGNADINTWVRELKDLMYDADDIIDLCTFRGGKLLEAKPSDSGVCLPISLLYPCFKCAYQHEISSRVEKLHGRFKEIAEDRSIIARLIEHSRQGPPDKGVISQRQTSSVEVELDIVGTQIEDLISSILNNDKQMCKVFGIVGMDGMGKTTLAHKIFNDKRIKENFPIQIWLHVSKNYSEIDLLKKIIRDAGGNIEVDDSKEVLVKKIAPLVSRNFFLVLDDVWRADVWENLLREPIINGAARAQILVTTRDEIVATSMRDSYIHHVQKMDEESGWKLLRKIVFGGNEIPGFEDLGISIVKKCDGLPLAIKVIGGVLISKERSIVEWRKVLESDLWSMNRIDEELPGALYLSYEELPLHLKPCFLYCALYPTRASGDLVRLWGAEGFIVEKENRSMEEIGEEYYRELIWRNLLQPDPTYADGTFFFMHDLLRSLGESLMEGEGISPRNDRTLNSNSSTKIRRLSMSNEGDTLTLPHVIMKQNCLRTLLLFDSPQTKTIPDDVLERLRHLRVLDLGRTSIGSLPPSIGELLHLRYLNIFGTKIREIPESIGRLANLQTLGVSNCPSLRGLPKAITRLHNLRFLALRGTPVTHVPRGIGTLKNLNVLAGFVVGHDDASPRKLKEGCDLEELQSLSKLRNLSIHRLERATNGASVLMNNSMLKRLVLEWTRFQAPCSEDQIKRAENIFSELSPPSSLKELVIQGFPGRGLPGWMTSKTTPMGDSLFPALAYLVLWDMPSCMALPPLGHLPRLQNLHIRGAEAIETIGPEFLGPGSSFPGLEYLYLGSMPKLKEWRASCAAAEERQLLPNLKECSLKNCPKLGALPDDLRHATKLEKLWIWNTNMEEINALPFLTGLLEVRLLTGLKRVSNLPSLKKLEIVDCSSLENVENLDALHELVLRCPPKVHVLPTWLSGLIEQQRSFNKFHLTCDSELLDSCSEGKANWHIIRQIAEVEIRTIDDRRFLLYTKDPYMYKTDVRSE